MTSVNYDLAELLARRRSRHDEVTKEYSPGSPLPAGRKPVGRRPSFEEVLKLIDSATARAFAAVNTLLIDLYWRIGE